ncbi:hypothetical protein NST02_01870 [Robertmurraya sp. FSL W8-0741]|uniref:hypothetical protein n=1 Tax=Robertmurraya sp. FSL W8-0741 TaxID=2954629 RepID=UPI0030FC7CF2
MKKFLMIFAIVLGSFALPNLTEASEAPKVNSLNESLTPQEISEIINDLHNKYDVGETVSSEDEEFLKIYAMKVSPEEGSKIVPMSLRTFTGVGSGGGTKARTLGTLNINVGALKVNYVINMTTAMESGRAEKITNKYEHAAWGIIGSGGLGRIYSKEDTDSCTNQSCLSTFRNEYFGLIPLYVTTNITPRVKPVNKGSYDIQITQLKN